MQRQMYLRNAPNVLIPVLLTEAEILVQSEAHIVAIETVGSEAQVQQVLLERCRDCGLSGCRETGEPDGEAGLLAVCVALLARKGRVPGDVAGGCQYARSCVSLLCRWWDGGMVGFGGGTHVDILLRFWVYEKSMK